MRGREEVAAKVFLVRALPELGRPGYGVQSLAPWALSTLSGSSSTSGVLHPLHRIARRGDAHESDYLKYEPTRVNMNASWSDEDGVVARAVLREDDEYRECGVPSD